MRWKPGRSSGNAIDARGSRARGGRVAVPGGLGLAGEPADSDTCSAEDL